MNEKDKKFDFSKLFKLISVVKAAKESSGKTECPCGGVVYWSRARNKHTRGRYDKCYIQWIE